MEILNGVFFNREDFATLTELARRDDETISKLRNEVEELKSALESVRKDRNAWREEAVNAKNAFEKSQRELKATQSDIRQVLDNNAYWIKRLEETERELREAKAKLEISSLIGTIFMVAAAAKE